MKVKRASLLTVLALAIAAPTSRAQFTTDLLRNSSYWGDGKAEVNLYDAQLARAGQPRKCEMLMIVASVRLDPKTFLQIDQASRADAVAAVRMSETWTAPIGLVVEQSALNAVWGMDGTLAQLFLIGSDSVGNFVRKFSRDNGASTFGSESYREGASSSQVSMPANGIFYEELPWRVRTLDWRKAAGEAEIQLASPLAGAKGIEFQSAKISWRATERRLEASVTHRGGTDFFSLDQRFPYLVREWRTADGSQLRLKRDLKVDYWNYTKNGDRERALNNPMLGHPD